MNRIQPHYLHRASSEDIPLSENIGRFVLLALCAFALSVFLGAAKPLLAQVMQSSSYRIQADSVNVTGTLSESSNYSIEDTVGETATGESESTTYKVKAGYQQMLESFISLSSPSDASLSSISGAAGGAGTGSVTWTVITDNLGGYTLSVKASTDPALKSSSSSFDDYTPSSSSPDFSFSVSASVSEFGFSPEGEDIVQRYLDNGSACGTGSTDTDDKCWDGFSTTGDLVSTRFSSNHPNGTETKLELRAEVGSLNTQDSGTYTATITATALAQ